ncbi:hypothetical protein ACKGJO_03210 [Gracilimonas sp. Q87]|uniref:hypothetical protein n=1 Tax=Gracilimonas sp. Q87 TaxID=3384766 RepID=UPI0039844F53
MTSFAIYEFIALIVALPLSYAMAWLARKHTFATYKDEVDRLYSAIWNGNEEDELNAWLKVYSIYLNKKAPRKKQYILKKIEILNKQKIYSSVLVNENGRLKNVAQPNKFDSDQT